MMVSDSSLCDLMAGERCISYNDEHRFSRCDKHINFTRIAVFGMSKIYNTLYVIAAALSVKILMANDDLKLDFHKLKF